ncbi:hypothetical protein ACLB1Q_14090 [Escherichia coli]
MRRHSTSVHAAQPITEPEFASDIVDRYAITLYAAVPRGWRWLLSTVTTARLSQLWRNATWQKRSPAAGSGRASIASLTKLMTSEMLVKLLDQGPASQPSAKQHAPPGATRQPTSGTPITLGQFWQPIPAPCPVHTARWRGTSSGVCLANARATLEHLSTARS